MMDRDLIKAGIVYRTAGGGQYRVVTMNDQKLTIQRIDDRSSMDIFECSLGSFAARAIHEHQPPCGKTCVRQARLKQR